MEQMTFSGACPHNCLKFRSNPFAKSGNIARVCNDCGCDIQDHSRAAVAEKDVLKALESNEKLPSLILGSKQNGLYQGGWQAAMNQTHLVDSNAGLVINTAGGLEKHFPKFLPKPLYQRLDIRTICFNWEDSSSTTFTVEEMMAAHDAIQSTLDSGKSVLVHCAQGRSRSGSVVVFHVSKSKGTSIDQALKMVQQKRAMCQPNGHFMSLLYDMSKASKAEACTDKKMITESADAREGFDATIDIGLRSAAEHGCLDVKDMQTTSSPEQSEPMKLTESINEEAFGKVKARIHGKDEAETLEEKKSSGPVGTNSSRSAGGERCLHPKDLPTTAFADQLQHVTFTEPTHDHPLVFLDIDGVLCLAGAGLYALPGRKTFDPGAVSALQGLVVASKASIVLTSSWRKREADLARARTLLEDAGILLAGSTPVIDKQRRDEEVVAWLSAHRCASPWVVLDDSPDKFRGAEEAAVKKRLVLVSASSGFTSADAERALKFLS